MCVALVCLLLHISTAERTWKSITEAMYPEQSSSGRIPLVAMSSPTIQVYRISGTGASCLGWCLHFGWTRTGMLSQVTSSQMEHRAPLQRGQDSSSIRHTQVVGKRAIGGLMFLETSCHCSGVRLKGIRNAFLQDLGCLGSCQGTNSVGSGLDCVDKMMS